jgi:hypothetical protein
MCGTLSRQYMHSATYQEWTNVEWEENKAHQGQVLLYKRQSRQRRGQSDGLYNQGDVGGHADKATTGNGIPNNERRANELSCQLQGPSRGYRGTVKEGN